MTYETEIEKWLNDGYSLIKEYDTHIFDGMYQYTLLSNNNLDKVRVYKNGNVWKSHVSTGKYQILYNYLENY